MIKPFNSNILIQKIKIEEKVNGIITTLSESDTMFTAEVLAIADNIEEDINIGDIIAYDDYSIKKFGKLMLININDILGKYEKD